VLADVVEGVEWMVNVGGIDDGRGGVGRGEALTGKNFFEV
jgi:hypothetical protein